MHHIVTADRVGFTDPEVLMTLCMWAVDLSFAPPFTIRRGETTREHHSWQEQTGARNSRMYFAYARGLLRDRNGKRRSNAIARFSCAILPTLERS